MPSSTKRTEVLGPIGLAWAERRSISAETVVRFKVYTGRTVKRDEGTPHERTEVVPDERGNVIVFPYEEHDVRVSEKYRAPRKRLWQREGGRRTFYNSDVLDDPALHTGQVALVIVEGEPDCLTSVDCGFPHTVSVPDGAPGLQPNEDPEQLPDVDERQEPVGKFAFVWNNRDRLRLVRRFVLAVDDDRAGRRLRAELLRRLSPARCSFVEYPEDAVVPVEGGDPRPCKDLNEVRMHLGAEAVAKVINGAKPFPVRGLYKLSDYPDLPPLETVSTGIWTLDGCYRPFPGGLTIVLGIPQHGKSVLVENLLVNWAEIYGWRHAVFSPEQPTVPQMRDRLRTKRLRKATEHATLGEINAADEWIEDHFLFIAADPEGHDEEEAYLEWVIERAVDAVMRYGIRVLVIDPWNEVEQLRRRGEMVTEYTARALRMLNNFRRRYGVLVILTVHPTKEVGKDGKSRPPTPYDTDGSAHFFNKADHFLVVHRSDETTGEVSVRIAKAKFKGTGDKGRVNLLLDRDSDRYMLLDQRDPTLSTATPPEPIDPL